VLDLVGVYSDEDFPDGKSLYCVTASSLGELPGKVQVPSRHFGLLLAADGNAWTDEEVLAAARQLVAKGLVVLVAWGPGCERVHDLFDHARDPDEPAESVVLTTWHGDETLDETLWYFVGCASPAEAYRASCLSWVAASIAHTGWAEHMHGRMEASKALLEAAGGVAEDGDSCCESIEAGHDEEPPQA
jgi:hypothetical protein